MKRVLHPEDICASCMFCAYKPGEPSKCVLDWPTIIIEGGVIQACDAHVECAPGANLVTAEYGSTI